MNGAPVDPIIAEALARQRAAADLIARGRDELRTALATARRHPDYARTERARRRRPRAPSRETMTLAWWVAECIHSELYDTELFQAAEAIVDDLDPAVSMRDLFETEEREEARRNRRRRATPKRVEVAP